MENNLFDRLVESVTQINEILNGERALSREFVVGPIQVKDIRKATELTQDKFCKLIGVKSGTGTA